jgi:hypothetical protein
MHEFTHIFHLSWELESTHGVTDDAITRMGSCARKHGDTRIRVTGAEAAC